MRTPTMPVTARSVTMMLEKMSPAELTLLLVRLETREIFNNVMERQIFRPDLLRHTRKTIKRLLKQ